MKPFSGSTVKDVNSYCQPVIDRAPDQILLNVGTNDLSNTRRDRTLNADKYSAVFFMDTNRYGHE